MLEGKSKLRTVRLLVNISRCNNGMQKPFGTLLCTIARFSFPTKIRSLMHM